jgi:hypothetical protein
MRAPAARLCLLLAGLNACSARLFMAITRAMMAATELYTRDCPMLRALVLLALFAGHDLERADASFIPLGDACRGPFHLGLRFEQFPIDPSWW